MDAYLLNCYSKIGSKFDRTSILLVLKHGVSLVRASYIVADRTRAGVRGHGVGLSGSAARCGSRLATPPP
ncbi:hypothetical protein QUA86_09130 [Microcoleus sp. F6_B6]